MICARTAPPASWKLFAAGCSCALLAATQRCPADDLTLAPSFAQPSAKAGVYRLDLRTGQLRYVAGFVHWALSPDGSMLAGTADNEESHVELRVVSTTNGTASRRLAVVRGGQEFAGDLAFAWSPDSTRLALVDGSERPKLALIPVEPARKLFHVPFRADSRPLCWPQGSDALFVCAEDHYIRLDTKTGASQALRGRPQGECHLSPHGDKVLYLSDGSCTVADLHGHSQVRSKLDRPVKLADWSGRGPEVLLIQQGHYANYPEQDDKLLSLDTASGQISELPIQATTINGAVQSPDGQWVLLACSNKAAWGAWGDADYHGGLYVVRRNGAQLTQITQNVCMEQLDAIDHDPAWLPGGMAVLFQRSPYEYDDGR